MDDDLWSSLPAWPVFLVFRQLLSVGGEAGQCIVKGPLNGELPRQGLRTALGVMAGSDMFYGISFIDLGGYFCRKTLNEQGRASAWGDGGRVVFDQGCVAPIVHWQGSRQVVMRRGVGDVGRKTRRQRARYWSTPDLWDSWPSRKVTCRQRRGYFSKLPSRKKPQYCHDCEIARLFGLLIFP